MEFETAKPGQCSWLCMVFQFSNSSLFFLWPMERVLTILVVIDNVARSLSFATHCLSSCRRRIKRSSGEDITIKSHFFIKLPALCSLPTLFIIMGTGSRQSATQIIYSRIWFINTRHFDRILKESIRILPPAGNRGDCELLRRKS